MLLFSVSRGLLTHTLASSGPRAKRMCAPLFFLLLAQWSYSLVQTSPCPRNSMFETNFLAFYILTIYIPVISLMRPLILRIYHLCTVLCAIWLCFSFFSAITRHLGSLMGLRNTICRKLPPKGPCSTHISLFHTLWLGHLSLLMHVQYSCKKLELCGENGECRNLSICTELPPRTPANSSAKNQFLKQSSRKRKKILEKGSRSLVQGPKTQQTLFSRNHRNTTSST